MKVWLLFLTLLPFLPNAQTCIIAKISGGKIFIGADSRKTKITYQSFGNDTVFNKVCKIHKESKYYFAAAGALNDTITNIIRLVSNKSSNINEFASNFFDLIRTPLLDTLSALQNYYPSVYNSYILHYFIQVIIGYYENGNAKLFCISLIPLSKIGEPLKIHGDISHSDNFVIGMKDHIKDNFDNKNIWNINSTPAVIKKLIQKEIDKDSIEVGSPIDIIEIDEKKDKWFYNLKHCSLLMSHHKSGIHFIGFLVCNYILDSNFTTTNESLLILPFEYKNNES